MSDTRAAFRRDITINGIDIPFSDLMWFMVKVSLASIPATIIVVFTYLVALAVLGGVVAAIIPK
jgi:hypothetical protein